jgi:thiamine transport system ATP-binding protein
MLTLDKLKIGYDGFNLSADLKVPQGARVAVIGPSGAGKSTLLAAMAGFLTPTSGRILWQDQDMTDMPPGKRPLSMLFQEANLFPHLTIAQNVALGIRPNLRLSPEQKDQVHAALTTVGLQGFAERRPAALSGGQQSRVALARVLVRDRPLVLLDEPFAALGPAMKAEMLDLVATLLDNTGATLLMVSHDPADALRIAPQTILVAEGQAHAPQGTQTLLANPPPALRAYLGT